MGTWFVYDPKTNVGGDGAFYPNSFLRLSKFADGTSKTLLASEVKAWTHYTRTGGPSSTTIPDTVDALAGREGRRERQADVRDHHVAQLPCRHGAGGDGRWLCAIVR
jgi:hypothetical protein